MLLAVIWTSWRRISPPDRGGGGGDGDGDGGGGTINTPSGATRYTPSWVCSNLMVLMVMVVNEYILRERILSSTREGAGGEGVIDRHHQHPLGWDVAVAAAMAAVAAVAAAAVVGDVARRGYQWRGMFLGDCHYGPISLVPERSWNVLRSWFWW